MRNVFSSLVGEAVFSCDGEFLFAAPRWRNDFSVGQRNKRQLLHHHSGRDEWKERNSLTAGILLRFWESIVVERKQKTRFRLLIYHGGKQETWNYGPLITGTWLIVVLNARFSPRNSIIYGPDSQSSLSTHRPLVSSPHSGDTFLRGLEEIAMKTNFFGKLLIADKSKAVQLRVFINRLPF